MKTTELKSLQLKSYIMQNSNERGKTKKKKYTAVQRADTQNYKAVTNAKFIQQLFSGHRLHFFPLRMLILLSTFRDIVLWSLWHSHTKPKPGETGSEKVNLFRLEIYMGSRSCHSRITERNTSRKMSTTRKKYMSVWYFSVTVHRR